jgi:hypothetical protein
VDAERKCGGINVRLLDIQSSPRGESVDSIAHTKPFIEANGNPTTPR